jgi:hypothetical protein
MSNHKATAEQWAHVERCGSSNVIPWDTAACLLELRSRVEALEAQAQPLPPQPATTPPQGLVEQVRLAIETSSIEQEPRAAIRAVAAWLRDHRARGGSAFELEQEAGQ